MHVAIVDPSLCSATGHMLSQASELAKALRKAQYTPRILSHAALPMLDELEGINTERLFSVTQYDQPDSHPLSGRMQSHARTVPVLAHELEQAFLRLRNAEILVPTVNATMLSAIVRALASIGPDAAKLRLHLCLTLECGLALGEDGKVRVTDSWLAWVMRSAFLDLAAMGIKRLHLLGVSTEMARLYGELSEMPVTPTPCFHPIRRLAEASRPAQTQILLYAGQASSGKGFERLATLAPLVVAAHPEARVVVQLHRTEKPGHADVAAALRQSSATLPNLHLIDGYLPDADLVRLMHESATVVLAYAREHYSGKTSGFLWEAVAAGRTVVVPAETWLAREAAAAGGSVVAYGPETAEAILAAIDEAVRRAPSDIPDATLHWGPDSLVTDHMLKVAPPPPPILRRAAMPARLFGLAPHRQLDLGTALSASASA